MSLRTLLAVALCSVTVLAQFPNPTSTKKVSELIKVKKGAPYDGKSRSYSNIVEPAVVAGLLSVFSLTES
jgi:hypothetical protein